MSWIHPFFTLIIILHAVRAEGAVELNLAVAFHNLAIIMLALCADPHRRILSDALL